MKLVHQLLLLLSLLPQPTTPALSDFYLPIGSSQNSEPTCIGIDTQYTYLCTDDPAAARNALGLDDIRRNEQMFINTGVDQRISGTESEILNVKEVLMDMAKYMDEEVMSRSEYAHVRGSCRNEHELCAFWTSLGECETNRVFMLQNCAAACRLCLLQGTNMMGG